MSDTATSPQLERATFPWSRPDGLPLLPDTVPSPELLYPAVPVVLLGEESGRALELRLHVDSGCDSTVVTMQAARALGLDGLAPDGEIEFPLPGTVVDVFSARLPAIIAGVWQVETTIRFVEPAAGVRWLGSAGPQRARPFPGAWVPEVDVACHANQSIEFRSYGDDPVLREDSTGTYWGRPAEARGGRMWLPSAGDDNRTTRIAVLARRSDIDTMPSEHVTDAISVIVSYRPRYLVIPRQP